MIKSIELDDSETRLLLLALGFVKNFLQDQDVEVEISDIHNLEDKLKE